MTYRKKLIEVALPLNAINEAAITEKSIRHGHPSTLHLWWARRPLATCRAVLFASLIDDPSEHPEEFPTEEAQEQERERLFAIIRRFVEWKNSNNEHVLAEVRREIQKATGGNPPPVLDPFAGGGSIPLEAQRMGLEAHASDLNPVAVLINKALIEIPPKFANCPPVNPEAQRSLMGRDWHGAQGLADDIRYYGKWMRDEAQKRIGHLYPKATLSKEYGGGEATVIAWLWARTVTCPNPACGTQMPLVRSFYLSKKKGKETYVEPHVAYSVKPPVISFTTKIGQGKPQDGTVNRQGATCLACHIAVPFDYIRSEGRAGRMKAQLMALVAEGNSGRAYLVPDEKHIISAAEAKPQWNLEAYLPQNPRNFNTIIYGLNTFDKLFTSRQLVTLMAFSELVQEVRENVLTYININSEWNDNTSGLQVQSMTSSYADALATYLAIAVDRLADRNSAICSWDASRDSTRNTFARQAIPMVWDFAEANPFSDSTGNFMGAVDWITDVVEVSPCYISGKVSQCDATTVASNRGSFLVSTDPPYYDNIDYADLSDFFYVWLRRSLYSIYPDLFRTMMVPKAQELVATPYRFGGDKKKAQKFFEDGLAKVFEHLRDIQHDDYPLTVYYAFKQAESESEGNSKNNEKTISTTASTGWETMLEGLIKAEFEIVGTWPVRTEMENRSVGQGANALASSIVLVCRRRPLDAPVASRRMFLNALKAELPRALKQLQHGSIAPVDLAQASIGPGMGIYSRYSRVEESNGTLLGVRAALQLINRALDEVLAEQEGEYDAETRWAVAWFEQFAMGESAYGVAETLSKAKNVAIESLREAGILESKAGKVRLLKREELAKGWNPRNHPHLTVWEVMQRMIYGLQEGKGEIEAGNILRDVGEIGEIARDLAYRLYTVCERKGWTQEALAYNSLVVSWSQISQLAQRQASDQGLWETTYLG